MKVKTALALVGAMLALSALPAKAETKHSWSGVYVGIHGGYDIASTDVAFPGPFSIPPWYSSATSIDGLSSTGVEYGVHGGFDYQVPGSRIVVGLGGDYTWSDAKGSYERVATLLGTAFTTTATVEIEKSWAVYGRLGIDMGPVMPYALAGYTRVDVPGATVDGWLVGAGMELMLGGNLYLGGEYRYSNMDDVKIGPATFEGDRHEVRAKLSYKFGGLF
jgi:outer membrane immunogenic protein